MNISAINAVNTSTNSNKPKPVTTPVNFEGVNSVTRKGNLMKGLALAGMLAAATAFVGCAQPTGGNIPQEETPIENPTEPTTPPAGDITEPTQPTEPSTPVTPSEPTKPDEPTTPPSGDITEPAEPDEPTTPTTPSSGDITEPSQPSEPTTPPAGDITKPTQPTEPSTPVTPSEPTEPDEPTTPPTGDITEPTTPVNPSEPTIPTQPVVELKDTPIYQLLSSFGCFDLSTEKVTVPEGHYQPKTGDIIEIGYDLVDDALDCGYKYTLDTENSTEGNLKFKGEFHDVYGTENVTNNIIINKDEKSITFHDLDVDHIDKFTLNSDGTITGYERFAGGTTGIGKYTVGENGSLYGVRGETIANIKVKLAE